VRVSSSALNADQDVSVEAFSDSTVRALKQQLHERLRSGAEDGDKDTLNRWEGVGLPPECVIMLRFGAVLHDDANLQASRVANGCYVQAFVVHALPARVLRRKVE